MPYNYDSIHVPSELRGIALTMQFSELQGRGSQNAFEMFAEGCPVHVAHPFNDLLYGVICFGQ